MPTKHRHALPAEVAKKYQLTAPWFGAPTQFFGKFGNITIADLTLEKADRLFQKGWKRIKLIEKPAKKTTESAASKPAK